MMSYIALPLVSRFAQPVYSVDDFKDKYFHKKYETLTIENDHTNRQIKLTLIFIKMVVVGMIDKLYTF